MSARLEFEGEMTIYQVAEQKKLLQEALRENEALEVDLSRVVELDTAGVQLMLVAQREAVALGKSLKWGGHSHAVLGVLRRLSLESELGETVAIVGA
ncbi:STAS domain-containing protein [Niveibacterium terrae]|uniref:STAS domain-containing protein n=1 Tax=Niveibacterium terrae TaxID=3373598 RepID=UPI003A95C056